MEKAKDSIVRRFKRKIEAALQLYNDMSPTDRAQAALLWNVTSEKLQSIINKSSDALKQVSVIVVKNARTSNEDPDGQASKIFLISGREFSEEDLNTDQGNGADPLSLNDQNERPLLSKAIEDNAPELEEECSSQENEDDNNKTKTNSKEAESTEDSPDEIIRSLRGPLGEDCVRSGAVKDISEPKVVEKNRWSCNNCDKQFDEYVELQTHISEEHLNPGGVKQFKCNQCDKSFTQKSNLKVHERKHSGIRPFACPRCTARFSASSNLRRHLLSHQGVKPYQCSLCTARFTEKRSLQNHHRTHAGERPFSCPECDLSFQRKSVLKIHMATHSDARPFLCSECGKSFKTKTLLRSHENNSHRSEQERVKSKDHACHYCSSTFARKSDLSRHEMSHRGERRFLCQEEGCGKAFMRKQSLKEHMNRHQGIKPYKCSHCTKAYPQLSEYLKHCKTHVTTSSSLE